MPRSSTDAFEGIAWAAAAETWATDRKYGMPTADTFVASIEFRFLVDRCLAARNAGQTKAADVFAHAAEGLLTTVLPNDADAIASVASRKGEGRLIGGALAQRLSSTSAAAVNVIWLLRGARRPAIDALSSAFRDDVFFNDTIRLLCARVFSSADPMAPVKPAPIEIAAAYRR